MSSFFFLHIFINQFQNYYKTIINYMLGYQFNPFKTGVQNEIADNRKQYGQAINSQNKFGLFKKNYVQYSDIYEKKAIDTNVQKFTTDNLNQINNQRYFKSKLTNNIQQGIIQSKYYQLSQISLFFPWVFSQQFLFQPMRSDLYRAYNGLKPDADISQLQQQQINSGAVKAVYRSIKDGALFLSQAMNKLDSSKKYMATITQTSLKFLSKLFSSFTGLFAVGTNTAITTQADILTQLSKDTNKKAVFQAITQMYSQLRCYGEIIINFSYLKHNSQKLISNGITYYYMWNAPQLLLTIQYSFPRVYLRKQGIIELIPQATFTKKLLLQYVQNQLKTSGLLLQNQYQQLKRQTNQQKNARQAFSKTYWGLDDETKRLKKQAKDNRVKKKVI